MVPLNDTVWVLYSSKADSLEVMRGIFRSESAARTGMFDLAIRYGYLDVRDESSYQVDTGGYLVRIEECLVKG